MENANKVFCAVFLVSFLPNSNISDAWSQTNKSKSANCNSIVAPTDRLACYDQAFGVVEPKRQQDKKLSDKVYDLKSIVSKENICNIRTLYEKISASVGPKSPYETKEAYGKRGYEQLIASNMKTSGIFCRSLGGITSFDAERGGFEVNAMYPYANIPDEDLGQYEAKNLFGSKVSVRRIISRAWQGNFFVQNSAFAKVSANVAQSLGRNVAGGVILTIAPPFHDKTISETEPNLPKLVEEKSEVHEVFFEPNHVLIYNTETFEIIWSKPIVECSQLGRKVFSIENCGYDEPWVNK